MNRHPLSCSLLHLPDLLPGPFLQWFRVSNFMDCPGVYSFDGIYASEFNFESFLVCLRCLFQSARLQYSQVLVISLFSQRSESFLVWKVFSFRSLYFSTFHNQHGPFFFARFHVNILVVYLYCLYQSLQLINSNHQIYHRLFDRNVWNHKFKLFVLSINFEGVFIYS